MIAGSVVREGNPFIMLGIGIIISILLIICIWITLVVTLLIILLFRPYFPPETSAEEVVLNILTIITVVEGIIFMFLYVLRCLHWDSHNTQEEKLKIKTKEEKKKAKKRKMEKKKEKAKKANDILLFSDNQINEDADQSIIKSKDVKKKSEEIKEKEYPTEEEIDIKAKNIRDERISRANDSSYRYNGKFVDQLLKNAGITKETLEAEVFMRKWDQAEAKRQLTKIQFCPYCLTEIEKKDEQLNGEYLCSSCDIKSQKKSLIIEEKIKEK